MVKEFASIAQRIGLFSERARLVQKPYLITDITINMSLATPEKTAEKLAGEIKKLSAMKSFQALSVQ